MSGLTVNEIVDLSIILVAHEDELRAIDLAGRLSELSGGWFAPCGDVVASRVEALEAAGCIRLVGSERLRHLHRLEATADGLDYVRVLAGKAAPQPCAAAVLWSRLRLALRDILPAEARSATILEMAKTDAGLPPMTPWARDLVATGT